MIPERFSTRRDPRCALRRGTSFVEFGASRDGALLTGELVQMQLLTRGYSSVAATATLGLPLAVWVWFGTVAPLRKGRAARG